MPRAAAQLAPPPLARAHQALHGFFPEVCGQTPLVAPCPHPKLKGGQRRHMLGRGLSGTWVLGPMPASPQAAGGATGLGQPQDTSPRFCTAWGCTPGFYPEILCLTSPWQMLSSRGGETGIARQPIRFDGSLLRGNPLDYCPGQIRLRGLNSQGRHPCPRSKSVPQLSPQRHHLQP